MWAVLITAQWGLIRWGFSGGSASKASAYDAGDPGSIQGLGRSPGEGNGNPLQYSGLENPMDCHKELDITEQLSETSLSESGNTFTVIKIKTTPVLAWPVNTLNIFS